MNTKVTFADIEQMDEEAALEVSCYLVEQRGILRARLRFERLAPVDADEVDEEIARLGFLISAARFRAKRLRALSAKTEELSAEELQLRLLKARRDIERLGQEVADLKAEVRRNRKRINEQDERLIRQAKLIRKHETRV